MVEKELGAWPRARLVTICCPVCGRSVSATSSGSRATTNWSFWTRSRRWTASSWVGNCNELNAAYAADGYSRLNGISALVTTFSVGELSALNGVAGAFAESVPLVSIVGTPATFVMEGKEKVHHTVADGDFTHAATCAGEYTVAQAMLGRDNAASEIDRVLRSCWLRKRPVYLMLPSDVANETIEAPTDPLDLPEPSSDPYKLRKFADQTRGLLDEATSVAVLVGPEVDRYRLGPQLIELVEALGCPVASLSSTKGVFPEDHDQFVGGYAGRLSDPYVRETIENAGCLLAVGTQFTDSVTGGFSQHIEGPRVVAVHPMAATVGGIQHAHVCMRDALGVLTGMGGRGPAEIRSQLQRRTGGQPAEEPVHSTPLTQERFWTRMQAFLQPGDVLVAEQGTSYFGSADLALPRDCTFVGQPLWGSIGYTLPALLGTMLAAPDRRHILLIGDGSFQLTAQELSTLLRHGLAPVIVLVNNDGYTVERCILGANAASWVRTLPTTTSRRGATTGWSRPSTPTIRRSPPRRGPRTNSRQPSTPRPVSPTAWCSSRHSPRDWTRPSRSSSWGRRSPPRTTTMRPCPEEPQTPGVRTSATTGREPVDQRRCVSATSCVASAGGRRRRRGWSAPSTRPPARPEAEWCPRPTR